MKTCPRSHRALFYVSRICPACTLKIPQRYATPDSSAPPTDPPAASGGQESRSKRQQMLAEREHEKKTEPVETSAIIRKTNPAPVRKKLGPRFVRTTIFCHEAIVRFPHPVPGAPAEPIRAQNAVFGLRRSMCARQSDCLNVAVKAGWRGYACTSCTGYVEEPHVSAGRCDGDTVYDF